MISTRGRVQIGKGFDCTVQHDPAVELLVHRLLGIAAAGRWCWRSRRSPPAHRTGGTARAPDREEVSLARVGEVDCADPPAVLLEHDARVLERAARLGTSSSASSGPISPPAIASSRSSSVASKLTRSRSKFSSLSHASSCASSSSLRPACRASWLSAIRYARFCASLRCSNRITGTSASPSLRAASSRPWPARMPAFSSIRIGLVHPNSTIDAAIWSTCASLCVRGRPAWSTRNQAGFEGGTSHRRGGSPLLGREFHA